MNKEADYKFCPKCKGKFLKDKNNLLVCSQCKFHYYINPKLANAIILKRDNNKILLVKRKVLPKIGWWDLPGGFVEINETLEQSMERETKEELGICLKKYQYFRSYYDNYLYQGINYATICGVFIGKLSGNEKIKPEDDISEAKFFLFKDIPFSKIAFSGLQKALQDYQSLFSLHQSQRSKSSKK